MLLNKIEFILMNNNLRYFIQEKYEVQIFKKFSSLKDPENVLEIGCGNGTKLIKKYFNPKNITAIDLDNKMIKIAQSKNNNSSINYKIMDASNLKFQDNSFDSVFDFGIIHHIPNWKNCVEELYRVLKPGGELILEELSIETFSTGIGTIWKKLLDHPYNNMFSINQFVDYISKMGFEIINFKKYNPLRLIKHFSLNAIKH